MKKLLTLTALLLLPACVPTPEQAAENARMQAEADSNTCKSYGLRPGSEAFGNCRLQLDLARQRPYYYDEPYWDRPHVGMGYYYLRH